MTQIDTFLKKLTVLEKASLVSGEKFWFTSDLNDKIPNIMMTDGPSGLRKQDNDSDALGLSASVEAISFPSAALVASSFNSDMVFKLGEKLGQAAKAENVSILLGPGINIKRTPLAGRNFEYFSEDPYLSGTLGSAYVNGVQGQGVGVSLKHFAVNNRENQRFTVSSNLDERSLREIYLYAFEKIVKESNPATIMCSYNAINGVLSSENYRLLTEILREEWGFNGLVVSDWGAVADNVAALKAGLDLEMPGNGDFSINRIVDAIDNNRLDESILNKSVLRVLNLIENFKIDDSKKQNYNKEEQHNFARELAAESLILLKNEKSILPVKKNEKIGIIGELAERPRTQGGGSSHVNSYKIVTPLEAADKFLNNFSYSQGYKLDDQITDETLMKDAIKTATSNDKIIIFAGVPEKYESEGFDKKNIDLPDNQIELINILSKYNQNIIVVLQNGSAISMPWKNKVRAIVETYLAGETVGESTFDVLSGAVNPSGKLAETFPIDIKDTPSYGTFNISETEENYHEGIFVGYKYYDIKNIEVNYPFGFGLSYTEFEYSNLNIENLEKEVIVQFDIKNIGKIKGKEVPQLYINNLSSDCEMPINSLQSFDKVEILPGEKKSIIFKLSKKNFSRYDVKSSSWIADNGYYDINIGSSSRNIHLSERICLRLGEDINKKINSETYIADILDKDNIKKCLKDSGLLKHIEILLKDESNKELLSNMPLRALIMIGAQPEELNKFIDTVNKQN